MTDLLNDFDPVAYWGERPVWVVTFDPTSQYLRREQRTVYVRARTRDGAIRTARANCSLRPALLESCRMATPQDLGCKPQR